ncbi:hypothetical protein [Paractinoplanes rishiriensis]|nr:hypothetical protein [Actinoplanes rishiriensis]
MANTCAQAYLDSVFQLFAAWGVDFVKVDDIAAPTYRQAEVEGYRLAIQRSGRPMVLSLSPGPTPLASASHVQANAHMWRIVNDLWDNFSPRRPVRPTAQLGPAPSDRRLARP